MSKQDTARDAGDSGAGTWGNPRTGGAGGGGGADSRTHRTYIKGDEMTLKLAVTLREKELQAHFIDALANDYYLELLNGLPNGEAHDEGRAVWDHSEEPGWNMYCALQGIPLDVCAEIGRAIRDGKGADVGRLVIKAVTDYLREEARERADESLP